MNSSILQHKCAISPNFLHHFQGLLSGIFFLDQSLYGAQDTPPIIY
jgi:hypothetical protein